MSEQTATAGFWCAVILAAIPALYPISFGPACWITSKADVGTERITLLAYRPLTHAATTLGIGWAVRWYAEAGAAQGWHLEGPRERKDPYFPPRL